MMLMRNTLARVLESKLRAEIASSRGRSRQNAFNLPVSPWREDLRLFGEAPEGGLDCDSLERMWLAGAVNEMFHIYESGTEGDLLKTERFGQWLDIVGHALTRTRRLTFTTSGSTGAPKRCTHELADLECEIAALADIFSDRTRIVSSMPSHHIYGFLFTAMLPDELRVGFYDSAGLSPGELASCLTAGDLLVSFPDHWRYLEQSLSRVPGGVIGTTSTAPCPRWLIEALIKKGLASMIEVYGSSETAGIGTRAWPDHTYSLLPHWQVKQEPAERAITLAHRSGRQIAPMDNLMFLDERRFSIEGRVDQVVQVGGINVHPEHIAKRLSEHPLVKEAAVRLMRPDEGNRLKAFVVLSSLAGDEGAAHVDLSRWIESELQAVERPKTLTFGSAIPRGALGKLSDW
jgi:long-chain acyl-CoA synthetase